MIQTLTTGRFPVAVANTGQDSIDQLKGSQPIINSLPHLRWHPKGILWIVQCLFSKYMKRVREYGEILGYNELH
jgi:hypothetical protein